jgi:hypothetical protein
VAANDSNGFDERHLLKLAKALARAEAAGLASQGARQARWRVSRRGRGLAANDHTLPRSGADAVSGRVKDMRRSAPVAAPRAR